MKKSILITLIIFLLLFVGCSEKSSILNYKSDDYVELYDYSSITIDKSYVEVSDDDIEAIINTELSFEEQYIIINNRTSVTNEDIIRMDILFKGKTEDVFYIVGSGDYSEIFDLSVINMKVGEKKEIDDNGNRFEVKIKGIYRTATAKDTDTVLNFYGYSNMKDLKKYIKERAKKEIIFNYVWDKIINDSKIKSYPNEINLLIENDIYNVKESVENEGKSIDEYLSENNLSYDDLYMEVSNKYNEIMLQKAFLDQNNVVISDNDIEEYVNKSAKENNCSKEEIMNSFSCYDIYNLIAEEKIQELIINHIQIKNK